MSWVDYFNNMRGHHVKKAMFDLLQERYAQNEPIIDRLSVILMTESDITTFLKFAGDLYEAAYMKAVKDHKEALQKAGLVANIVKPEGK